MNRKELEEEVGKFDLKRYKSEQKIVENLRRDFVNRFSVDRILKMTIDEYAEGKGIKEDNFCYEIEWNLRNLGSIVGATAQKFGIYYSNKKKGYYVAKYWERDNLKDSFNALRKELANLIEAGANDDLETIRNCHFSAMFKGKILAVYYPERYLNVFSESHLDFFIQRLELDFQLSSEWDIFDKREVLVSFKNAHSIMRNWPLHAFSEFLYKNYPGSPSANEKPAKYIDNIEPIEGDYTSLDESNLPVRSGKGDYEAQSRSNRILGERGEAIVMRYESNRLKNISNKLKPKQVSQTDDSLGYDILSYNDDGSKRYIEVKTTNNSLKDFKIYITSNEVSVASSLGKDYHIYVVFKPNTSRPRIFDLSNPFMEEGKVTLIPINYKLHLKKV